MKFLITMNMPSNNGKPTTTMIVDHPSVSLDDFANVLSDQDMVTARMVYNDNGAWVDKGDVIINPLHVGKVQVYDQSRTGRPRD